MSDRQERQVFSRRTMLQSAAGAATLASSVELTEASANVQAAKRGFNKSSAPSDLKITDMRACTIAANYDYPIIRIDTNQGVYGLGEVKDAGVKGLALILKAHTRCAPEGYYHDYQRYSLGKDGRALKLMHEWIYADEHGR